MNARFGALPLVLAALLVLVLTATAFGAETPPGDVAVARWIQSAPGPTGEWLGWLGYWIGSAPLVIALGVVLVATLWTRGHPRLAVFAFGILFFRAANPVLKAIVASPRPTDGDVVVRELASGYGFPSGHVMGATLLYGGIIWLAERTVRRPVARRLVQAIAVVLVFVTALGRVASGAHWPSDVLGGLLWGLAGLVALAIVVEHAPMPNRSIAADGEQSVAAAGRQLRNPS
jgi:membrane-associated phospholipid phosphatase